MFFSLKAAAPAPSAHGIFDRFAQLLNLEYFLGLVGLSMHEALILVYFFGGACAVGFVFKKYFKFIISFVFLGSVLMIILESKGIMHIDWDALRAISGLSPQQADFNNLFALAAEWIKMHVSQFVAGCFGFFLGYKMG